MPYRILKNIEKHEFISQWIYSEQKRKNQDQSALDRIKEHQVANYKYSLIELNESSLSIIILPKHNADHHYFKVTNNLFSLADFSAKYSIDQLTKNPDDECIISMQYQIDIFQDQINSHALFLERDFIYISPDSELSIKDQESKVDYLYAGGFHQLAAYSLLTNKIGFYPLRLYLCEKE